MKCISPVRQRSALVVRLVFLTGLAICFGMLSSGARLAARPAPQQGPPSVQGGLGLGTTVLNAAGDAADPNAALLPPIRIPSASSQPGTPGPSAGLTINVIFDSSITSDANAASIEATINTAVANIQSQYSDPITVTILFRKDTGISLGRSTWYYGTTSYSTFINALRADASTPNDTTAIALLPSASTNPINGSSFIAGKLANLRAVGLSGFGTPANRCPPSDTVTCDGWIDLNTSKTNPGSPGSTLAYSLLAVTEHEIDEVLGLGSGLDGLPNPAPEDLFRYDVSGNRTYSTADSRTSGVRAYFSLDGFTDLAEFDNQNDGGDFGDWQSSPRRSGVAPKVQDAFATAGGAPALSVELTALDVIGYNQIAPSPSISSQPASQTIASGSTATMSVTASGDSLTYQWYVGTSGNTTSSIGGATSNSYTTPALISNTRYWVRVSNSGGLADSNTALITVTFTDSSLSSGVTQIRAVHVTELRNRINAIRVAHALSAISWPTMSAGATPILASDILQMRQALLEAYNAVPMTPPIYSRTPAVGVTVAAVDISELRTAVTTIE